MLALQFVRPACKRRKNGGFLPIQINIIKQFFVVVQADMHMSTNTIKFLYIVNEVQWKGKKLTTLQLFSNNDASDGEVWIDEA